MSPYLHNTPFPSLWTSLMDDPNVILILWQMSQNQANLFVIRRELTYRNSPSSFCSVIVILPTGRRNLFKNQQYDVKIRF